MLASATDGTGLKYPLLISPKLDGVRCIIVDGVALSRSLKPLPNAHVQRLFGRREFNGLDGELIVGEPTAKNVFQVTTSGVMSHAGKPDVRFFIFDDHLHPAPFKLRHANVTKRAKGFVNLCVVRHELVRDELHLQQLEEHHVSEGYEGSMLRDPHGPYKHGRSTLKEGWLLKLKRFIDSEAEVLGFSPRLHNTNVPTTNELGQTERSSHKAGKIPMAALGSLLVRDLKSKVEFEIGTGFTEQQRVELWLDRMNLRGKLVKYKSQPVGVKDKPRFPVFLGWRDRRDLS
jgi:DNA ligase-1